MINDGVQRRGKLMSNLFFSDHAIAIVSDTITPHHRGRIYYQDTYWFAYAVNDALIPVDTPVELLQFKDNTWLVQAIALQSNPL